MLKLRSQLFWKVFLMTVLLLGYLQQRQVLGQLFSGQLLFLDHPLINKAAPDFRLPMTSGKEKSLAEVRAGKKGVLFFWATWCPHCRKQLKELHIHKDEILAKDIKIILIDVGESRDQVLSHLTKDKIDFEVFLDVEQRSANDYQIVGVPSFFFVSPEGIVKAVKHSLPSNYDDIFSGR